ncbi:MAG TPA: helix-turn-helix transcriptional regulator [Syntrophomonadaceae bacterium]|nr:helix-turn-helix transcriptional regulator [Syntrophomonadaceae bacterium]
MNNSMTPEEVAALLKIKKNTVYELIKRGDLNAYRVGRKYRIDMKDIEVYKQRQGKTQAASDSSVLGKTMATPIFRKLEHEVPGYLVICGQDMLLDVLTRHLENSPYGYQALRQQVGSMAGLNALYHEKVDIATAHLWDGDRDEYNTAYVRYLVPGMKKIMIHLVSRMQGFYVAAGNPLNIKGWDDLTRPDVRMVNREKGSGARVLLDEKIRILDIDRRQIKGYEQQKQSHLEIASIVARGEADVGLGSQKASMQVRGIEFIPLQKERYDMVLLKERIHEPKIQAVIEVVRSQEFKDDIAAMGDYDVSEMGNEMEID